MNIFNNNNLSVAVLLILTVSGYSQKNTPEPIKFTIPKINDFNPRQIEPTFKPVITHLEAPVPGGITYRSALLKKKKEARKKYPLKESNNKLQEQTLTNPLILNGYTMSRYISALDDTIDIVGSGSPLDNTLAISNSGYLMAGINTLIYSQKLDQISVREDSIATWSFTDFAGNIPTSSPFDPKLIYDPDNDRFIATYLTGRNPSNSGLVLAFSQSNNPFGDWAVYLIPGNPLNDTSWADYPAIMVTKDELFYTVNLLIPSTNWKTAFKRTVIWQFNKMDGYEGKDSLTTNLWSEIAHNGRYLRNLAVVHGGDSVQGPNAYFLSNRNFDIDNDTIFLVEITKTIKNATANDLKVSAIKAKKVDGTPAPYGLPPNGRQEDSDPNDPEDGFDTNDSRFLGAFKVGNTVQFVGNTMDFNSGRAGIYHGIIENINTNDPTITGKILGNDSLDYGYPNLAFTGNDTCTTSAIIAFDHTSPTHYSGTSTFRYSNGKYSKIKYLKQGLSYVDRIPGSYERWGDYYGIQRKYNEPGVVWTAGFYGRSDNRAVTWITQLRDCDCYDFKVMEEQISFNKCDGRLKVEISNGIGPFKYVLGHDTIFHKDSIFVNLCDYKDTLLVIDSKGCGVKTATESSIVIPKYNGVMYPNPAKYQEVNIYFTLSSSMYIDVTIYNIEGKLIQEVLSDQKATEGDNLLTFSTAPLASGLYIVKVMGDGKEVYQGKLVKP